VLKRCDPARLQWLDGIPWLGVGEGTELLDNSGHSGWCPTESLYMTGALRIIGWPPEHLVIQKSDGNDGSELNQQPLGNLPNSCNLCPLDPSQLVNEVKARARHSRAMMR
jgi:hypothetical protein